MKLLIILLAMLGTIAGAVHSWHARGLLIEAALISEAFNLAAPVKLRVTDHYLQHGVMPSDNQEVDLPPPGSLYGTSVKRIAITRGGVLVVDFDDSIGARAMTFTPDVSAVSGVPSWNCTSDSIDRAVLEKLKPPCAYQPVATAGKLMHAIAGSSDLAIRTVVDAKAENRRLENLYQEYLVAAETCHVQRLTSLLLHEQELDSNETVGGLPLAENIRKPQCSEALFDLLRTKPSYFKAANAYLADRVQRCDVSAVSRVLADNPGIDVTEPYSGDTPVERSINEGCYAVLRLMVRNQNLAGKLDDDIIVEAINRSPQKTLVKMVGNLIAADANVNGIDQFGQTPLTTAIAMEQPVVAKILVDAGAFVDQITSNGSYPVIEATKKGYQHLVLQMVAHGADLNARDSLGRTALFAAVSRGQQLLVQVLIKAGANAGITDSNGINPVLLAETRNLKTIKSMLVASIE